MARRSKRLQMREELCKDEDNPMKYSKEVVKIILKDDCIERMIDQHNGSIKSITSPVDDDSEDNSTDYESDYDIEEFTLKFADNLLQNMKSISKNKEPELFIKLAKDSSISESEKELPTKIDPGEVTFESYLSLPSITASENTTPVKLKDISSVDETIKKYSVLSSDYEAKHSAPVQKSVRAMKKVKKKERLATAGKDWFHMKAPEMTDVVKRDLDLLQMRSLLDPKRFYKSNDRKTKPKYFQIGKIMDNAADFYSSRLPKKQRKATLAEELLADAEFKKYQKKKMKEIIAKRRALGGNRGRLKKKKSSLRTR